MTTAAAHTVTVPLNANLCKALTNPSVKRLEEAEEVAFANIRAARRELLTEVTEARRTGLLAELKTAQSDFERMGREIFAADLRHKKWVSHFAAPAADPAAFLCLLSPRDKTTLASSLEIDRIPTPARPSFLTAYIHRDHAQDLADWINQDRQKAQEFLVDKDFRAEHLGIFSLHTHFIDPRTGRPDRCLA